jgi:hypothetical protein
MQRVGGVVDLVPVPRDVIGCEGLWPHGSLPQLDRLLVGADIAEVFEAGGWASHETAAFLLENGKHSLHHGRVEEDVIVEVMDIRSATLLKEELALFGQTTPRQVAMNRHPMTAPAQGADKGLDLDAVEIGGVLSLIRDDDIIVGECLAKEAGQDDRQPGLAPAGGD